MHPKQNHGLKLGQQFVKLNSKYLVMRQTSTLRVVRAHKPKHHSKKRINESHPHTHKLLLYMCFLLVLVCAAVCLYIVSEVNDHDHDHHRGGETTSSVNYQSDINSINIDSNDFYYLLHRRWFGFNDTQYIQMTNIIRQYAEYHTRVLQSDLTSLESGGKIQGKYITCIINISTNVS